MTDKFGNDCRKILLCGWRFRIFWQHCEMIAIYYKIEKSPAIDISFPP